MRDGVLQYDSGIVTLGRINFQTQDGHIVTDIKMDVGGSFMPKGSEQYENFAVYLVACRGRVRAFTNWNRATEEMNNCYRPSKF